MRGDARMREAHPLERAVGMTYYVSDAEGTGGRLRDEPADFRVRELERFAVEPVDADPGSYPHLVFRATLTGWDTNDFAGALSKKLGVSRERVSWAGTKDKRAVTTQLFSLRAPDLSPDDFPALGDADVEVLGRAGRPVLFGDLAGNRFTVTVRDPDRPANAAAVTGDLHAFAGVAAGTGGRSDRTDGGAGSGGGQDADVADPGDGATTVAVPNYFGHQRFGAWRPVTHEVGLAVVRGSWEEAVLAYLTVTGEDEPADTREVREFVAETRDWGEALERLPGGLRYERSMLHVLAGVEGDPDEADFRRALEALPSNLQQLLVNAAQSYAFNRMLSARLERGLPFDRAVEGDVVCFADGGARSAPGRPSGHSPHDASAGLTLPDVDRLQRVDAGRVDSVNRHCERGRAFVTAPLVGTETDLADGEQGEVERAVLEDLGVEPGDFDLPGEFGSTGTRRAIQVRTDLRVERDPLRFEFALPKGSYATVLLREYLKAHPAALAGGRP